MANLGFQGGLTGLFQGLSEGATYVNEYNEKKKKEAEEKLSKSEDLYVKLMSDTSLRLKPGKTYKVGMTRPQVVELFEANPEGDTSATNRTLSLDEKKLLAKAGVIAYEDVSKEITRDTVARLQKAKDQNQVEAKLDYKMKADIAKMSLEYDKLADKQTSRGVGIVQDLMKLAVNKDLSFSELIEKDADTRKAVELILSPYGYSIDDKPKDTTWANFLNSAFGVKKGTTPELKKDIVQQQAVSTPTNTGTSVQKTDTQIIAEAKTIKSQNPSLSVQQAMDVAEGQKSLQQVLQESQSKTATPGVTESPELANQISSSLSQPQTTAPTTKQFTQQAALPIAKPTTQVTNPNQLVLDLAKKYRDALIKSPYQIK